MDFSLLQINLPVSRNKGCDACMTNNSNGPQSSASQFMPFCELLAMLANEILPQTVANVSDSGKSSEPLDPANENQQSSCDKSANFFHEAVMSNQQIALFGILNDVSCHLDSITKDGASFNSDAFRLFDPEGAKKVIDAASDEVKEDVPKEAVDDVVPRGEPVGIENVNGKPVWAFLNNDQRANKDISNYSYSISEDNKNMVKHEPVINLPGTATEMAGLGDKNDKGLRNDEPHDIDGFNKLAGTGQKKALHTVEGPLKYALKKQPDENIGSIKDNNSGKVDPFHQNHFARAFQLNDGLDISESANKGNTGTTPVHLNDYPENNGIRLKEGLNAVINLMRREGADVARITVHPPELGHIDVDLDIAHDGGLRAAFKVEGSNVANLLSGQLDSLKQTLNANGFQVLGLDVYVKGQGEDRNQHRGESNHRKQKIKTLEAINGKDVPIEMAFAIDIERGLLQWIA